MDNHIPAVADFHIQASPEAAGIQKLVIKSGESFLVSDRRGDFPAYFEGELGFYHVGTRHLRWLELRLGGERPLLLAAEIAPDNDRISVSLTNADLEGPGGSNGVRVPRNTVYLDRHLTLGPDELRQDITVSSFHDVPCEVGLEIIFSADFRDLFEVRGMHRPARGELLGEQRHDGSVTVRYRGLDGIVRATTLIFDPPPLLVAANRAVYRLALRPNMATRLTMRARATSGETEPRPAPVRRLPLPLLGARISTDNEAFNLLVQRSLTDLDMLLTDTPQGPVPYAGVPWYVAPFGRDSLVTALQLLPYHAAVAAGTLRFLAHWQGRRLDAFRDEEPGRILHEYRRGEMANCREIPFIPYYGSIDATPLFVVLLAEYVRWTGDVALVRELWPAAQAGLAWMQAYGDRDGDGYLEYATRSPLGLTNQGWKDSGDAVTHADGTLAEPPIALVEVQGYAYAAYQGAAQLAALLGLADEAARWQRAASSLREVFNRDFWLESEAFYALALDGQKRPCQVISSNPGHCLWAGIIDERRGPTTAKRLLADDMFSGWGIRTMSARECRYNPMSYHNGSVWPHDNAFACAGFRRYRLPDHSVTVASALFEAARSFEHGRMPELFCGFDRRPGHGPIAYPVACAPQAWAAGSVLHMVTALLGLDAEAIGGRLTCQSPQLPSWLRFIEIQGLRVGASSLDLGVVRGRDGASVELIARRGDVELIVRR